MVRVAVATDDKETVSLHFGKARYYLVYEIEEGVVKGREVRNKAGLDAGFGSYHDSHHPSPEMVSLLEAMLSNVRDCEALIAGGMGWQAYEAVEHADIRPFITPCRSMMG
jgi:predicted Fe-Mo cluster-binding NifX family protein